MAVTLKQIALEAGVSQPVVSAVLNKAGGGVRVSQKKREEIIRIADRLGYVPDFAAQKLRGKRTPTVGIIGGNLQTPMHTMLVSRLMIEFSSAGFFVLLNNDADSGNRMKGGREALLELMSRGIDGAVIIGNRSPETLETLKKLPCVFLRCDMPGHPFDYNIDRCFGAYMAVRHLLEHGHRKIISFAPENVKADMDKSKGFFRFPGIKKAFREFNVPLKNLEYYNSSADDGKSLFDMIRNGGYTAGITGNDFLAGRLIRFLGSAGISVPEDFAIIGYNGSSFAEFTAPPLTTLVQPLKLMASKASKLLLDRIENGICGIEDRKSEMLKPELLIGGSCGCQFKPLDEKIFRYPETFTLEK